MCDLLQRPGGCEGQLCRHPRWSQLRTVQNTTGLQVMQRDMDFISRHTYPEASSRNETAEFDSKTHHGAWVEEDGSVGWNFLVLNSLRWQSAKSVLKNNLLPWIASHNDKSKRGNKDVENAPTQITQHSRKWENTHKQNDKSKNLFPNMQLRRFKILVNSLLTVTRSEQVCTPLVLRSLVWNDVTLWMEPAWVVLWCCVLDHSH